MHKHQLRLPCTSVFSAGRGVDAIADTAVGAVLKKHKIVCKSLFLYHLHRLCLTDRETKEHQKAPLAVIMRVKMRSSDTDSREGIVNVSFMHGWNDAGGAGGQGRVTISSTAEDNPGAALWFRETDQQEMGKLNEHKTLSSGTNWKESHHNLHSWELQCRRR